MAAGTRTGRSRFTLIFLLLSSATLLTLDARDFEPLQRTEETLTDLISPLRTGADRLFGPIGDAWAGVTGYDELEAENQVLRDELQQLEGQQILDSDAAIRLEALLDELGLPYVQDIPNVVGRGCDRQRGQLRPVLGADQPAGPKTGSSTGCQWSPGAG